MMCNVMGNKGKLNVDDMNVHTVIFEVLPMCESSPTLMINAPHVCLEQLSTSVILLNM